MFTFRKDERLCSKKLIDEVFQQGHRVMAFPFSAHWMLVPEGTIPQPAQVLISTSKRKFHHAVDRNRVKRLMRECYRLHKPELYEFLNQRNLHLVISLNYIHTDIFEFGTLENKYRKLLSTMQKEIEKA